MKFPVPSTLISALCEIIGLVTLVVAGFMLHVVAGVAALGVALLIVGQSIARADESFTRGSR